MIKLQPSSNADSRTATEKVSKEVLLANSRQHIHDVKESMCWMAWKLKEISISHDWTKITHIDEFYDDFSAS